MESVDAALRYLQRQFASVASNEAQWSEERQKLQQQVQELEDQRGEQEQAYKDVLLRVKMLEFALRQERGRYLASPAAVSSTGGPNSKPRSESAEVSRGVTVSRSTERSKSARTVEQSPAPSPASSPKAYNMYRTDSRNKSAASTPKGSQTGKGTEISRPRMMSRTASGREGEREMSRTAETAKPLKPVVIPLAPKGSYRPHKLKLKLSGHMDGVRALAFHPTEPLLVSGSEDCTVKSVLAVAVFSTENYPDCPPGHAGAFSTAGRDGSLDLVHLPVMDSDKTDPFTYEDYEALKVHSVKSAHDDAIWDLHAHSMSNMLFSAGADGIVRTWGITSELTLQGELRCATKTNANASGPNIRGSLMPTSATMVRCVFGQPLTDIAYLNKRCVVRVQSSAGSWANVPLSV
ncbi:hypothetical protein BBJ29_001613 [Phytophthora kernoviae]|uniref:Striatin N-terminal domain-containing protein n=1 Tax=Phytophthora kernoviae TaxID=325452 RepID=A0A3F2RW97_9STRA|nr:hypothetical protein BBJ29_001613 [Phytophthora kernoviae]RLN65526.1 hypothetical protein BBP00_00002792 [Phytophthora kernoviae]